VDDSERNRLLGAFLLLLLFNLGLICAKFKLIMTVMPTKKETIIISLGGSLVAPGEIDINLLKDFKRVLKKHLGTKRFFILVGGGKICRVYQKALLEFGAKETDRDWIGINISKLNAEVVKQLFSDYSYQKIIADPNKKVKTTKDIVVGAGWKPGWSTDYDAVLMAKTHKIKTIINLTNVDYVYDLPALPTGQAGDRQAKIPPDFTNAKALKEVDWKSFQRIVGDKWTPGLSMPFDPRASKLAGRLKLKVIMINGNKIERLEDFLNSKPFIGTVIE
jgi:uridylate kinase